jgi:hypothetical protein
VKEEVVTARSLVISNQRKVVDLTVAGPETDQVEIDNLVEANCELQDMVHTLQKDVFYILRSSSCQSWP